MEQSTDIPEKEYAKFPYLTLNDYITKAKHDRWRFWNFKVSSLYCGDNKTKLVFTDYQDSNSHGYWKREAVAEFRLRQDTPPTLVENISWSPEQPEHHFDCSSLLAEDENKFILVLQFKVVEGLGLKPRPWDYYSPSVESNVCFIADGQRIYQNKQILAYHSKYFKTLLFGDFAEKNKDEIEIQYVSSECLIGLFDAMHGSHISDCVNAEKLLEYADRFDVPVATSHVMQYLIWDMQIPKYRKLLISDKYRLAVLQAKIFSEWTKDDIAAVSKETDQYIKQLSNQTLLAVVKHGWKKSN